MQAVQMPLCSKALHLSWGRGLRELHAAARKLQPCAESLRMAASPPRLDWSDPSTLFFETDPEGPSPRAGRVGYVFPLAESTDILQRLEALAKRVAAETPTLDRIRSPA